VNNHQAKAPIGGKGVDFCISGESDGEDQLVDVTSRDMTLHRLDPFDVLVF
jgi:hypothetical protein